MIWLDLAICVHELYGWNDPNESDEMNRLTDSFRCDAYMIGGNDLDESSRRDRSTGRARDVIWAHGVKQMIPLDSWFGSIIWLHDC